MVRQLKRLVVVAAICLLPATSAFAASGHAAPPAGKQSPDAKFDKTGDGWVDATDWKRMTPKERAAYARACVQALGQDPDARLGDGKTRADEYLEGLKSVYGQ